MTYGPKNRYRLVPHTDKPIPAAKIRELRKHQRVIDNFEPATIARAEVLVELTETWSFFQIAVAMGVDEQALRRAVERYRRQDPERFRVIPRHARGPRRPPQ